MRLGTPILCGLGQCMLLMNANSQTTDLGVQVIGLQLDHHSSAIQLTAVNTSGKVISAIAARVSTRYADGKESTKFSSVDFVPSLVSAETGNHPSGESHIGLLRANGTYLWKLSAEKRLDGVSIIGVEVAIDGVIFDDGGWLGSNTASIDRLFDYRIRCRDEYNQTLEDFNEISRQGPPTAATLARFSASRRPDNEGSPYVKHVRETVRQTVQHDITSGIAAAEAGNVDIAHWFDDYRKYIRSEYELFEKHAKRKAGD